MSLEKLWKVNNENFWSVSEFLGMIGEKVSLLRNPLNVTFGLAFALVKMEFLSEIPEIAKLILVSTSYYSE